MVRFVFVEPKYKINFGHSLRVLKNFGFDEIYVVKPRIKFDKGVEKFAKHAKDLKNKIVVVDSFEKAIKGVSIATTGIKEKAKHRYFNLITPKKLGQLVKEGKELTIIIGRDDIGLKREEIAKCDYVLNIESNRDYPTLNLSHALAIIAYFTFIANNKGIKREAKREVKEKDQIKQLKKVIRREIYKTVKQTNIREKEKVAFAISSIINRSDATLLELKAFLAFLKKFKLSS
jgi:TrmH family RNA methyltransferase